MLAAVPRRDKPNGKYGHDSPNRGKDSDGKCLCIGYETRDTWLASELKTSCRDDIFEFQSCTSVSPGCHGER